MIFPESELNKLQKAIEEEKKKGKTIVWTNGCFDIMHPGHIETFKKAKELGDILVVGLNGKDSPYWKTKPGRPINNEFHRSVMLANLKQVDYVYIFNDETPARPVDVLKPDIVLKGGDYYIKELKVESRKLKERIKEFNKIVEKRLIKKENGIIDITGIYKYFIENDLLEVAKNTQGFMGEGLVNVKNGGKVILVPIVEGCSTTNIVETLQPKEFVNLVSFWKKYKNKFKDLKEFVDWYYKKLNIHYFKKRDGRKFKQFQIYYFDLGQNIGGETNKKRPILILGKTNNFLKSKTILGAIITSLYNKKGNKKKLGKMDILLKANKKNGLKNDSIIKLGKIVEIDKKRVLGYFGKLDDSLEEQIFEKLKEVFGIKK